MSKRRQMKGVGLALLLLTSMAWFLCGGQPALGEKVTLHVAAFRSPGSEIMEKLVPEYLAANPQVKNIVIDHYPYVALREKCMTAFVGRTGQFDVVNGDCIWLAEFVEGKFVREIDTFLKDSKLRDPKLDIDDIVPALQNYLGRYPTIGPAEVGTTYQKQFPTYAFPMLTNTESLLYRKDLYEKYIKPLGIRAPGKTSEEAWTWGEFIRAARALTRDLDGDGKIDLWGMTLQAKRGNSVVWEFSNLMRGFGAKYFNPDWTAAIDSPEALDLLEMYVDFYRKYKVAPPGVTTWAHAEETAALTQGLAAMDATWNNELNGWLLDPATSKYWDQFEIAWMPMITPGTPKYPSIQGGYFLAVPTDSKHQVEAFKFIQWMSSKETRKKFVMMGGTPMRRSVMRDPEVLAKYPYIRIYSRIIETPYVRPNCPEWTEVENIVAIGLSEAMIGKRTPKSALEDMNWRLNILMQRAGKIERIPAE